MSRKCGEYTYKENERIGCGEYGCVYLARKDEEEKEGKKKIICHKISSWRKNEPRTEKNV